MRTTGKLLFSEMRIPDEKNSSFINIGIQVASKVVKFNRYCIIN